MAQFYDNIQLVSPFFSGTISDVDSLVCDCGRVRLYACVCACVRV